MKTIVRLLFLLLAGSVAHAELVFVNRNANDVFATVSIRQSDVTYPLAVYVPALSTVVVPAPRIGGVVTYLAMQSAGGNTSLDLSAAPLDVSGELNLLYLANGGVNARYVPVGNGPDVDRLWPWWFKGFGLGIGFCVCGAFVRMIRSARGATSLEL